MNRYVLIRRLRGPAILLLLGTLALLDQAGIIDHFWGFFWPLLLILIGALLLAERAALEMGGYDAQMPYACAPSGSGPYADAAGTAGAPAANPGTSIVPAETHEFGNGSNGGQS